MITAARMTTSRISCMRFFFFISYLFLLFSQIRTPARIRTSGRMTVMAAAIRIILAEEIVILVSLYSFTGMFTLVLVSTNWLSVLVKSSWLLPETCWSEAAVNRLAEEY